MPRALSTLSLSLLLLSGCVDNELDLYDDLESEQLEAIGMNGIGMNGIGMNGIGMNGLTGAALSVNPTALAFLRGNSLDSVVRHPKMMEILDDEDSQDLLTYLVECALEPGDSLKLASKDGTFEKTVLGAFGIAPGWHYAACDLDCQEAVSACLFSRINPVRERVMISARTAKNPRVHPQLYDIDPVEKLGFPRNEASFFGNYFVWEYRVGHPQIYACSADDSDPRLEALVMRLCGDMAHPFEFCEDIVLGSCSTDLKCPLPADVEYGKVCQGPSESSGAAAKCSSTGDLCDTSVTPVMTNEVVTIYRSLECAHPDYEEGRALNPFCSPCAFELSEAMPHCTSDRWDWSCVKASATICPEHSITRTGGPLTRGTSDAVTAVCEAKPSCCDDAWTSTCRWMAYDYYF